MIGISLKNLRFLGTLLLAAAALIPESSYAAPGCTTNMIPTPSTFNVPQITVTKDTPVNTVLARVKGSSVFYQFSCEGGGIIQTTTTIARAIGSVGIISVLGQDGTPIPGLGMRLSGSIKTAVNGGGCDGWRGAWLRRTDILQCNDSVGGPGYQFGTGFGDITITFIKTSNALTSATLGNDDIVSARFDNHPPQIYRIVGGSKITVNACSFNVPASVSLGSMSAANLQSKQTGAVVPFRLGINCDDSVRLKIRFTPSGGSAVVAGKVGEMTNSDTSATGAQGANVQLLDDQGRPVVLASDINYGVQSAAATLGFGARMVPSGATVRQGKVVATVTATATFE